MGEEGLRSSAAGALAQPPAQPLGSALRTGGGDSEPRGTDASSIPERGTRQAVRSVAAAVEEMDSAERRREKESPGSPAAATRASAGPTRPLYCLY